MTPKLDTAAHIPGQVRVPLELTANVATPLPGNATFLRKMKL